MRVPVIQGATLPASVRYIATGRSSNPLHWLASDLVSSCGDRPLIARGMGRWRRNGLRDEFCAQAVFSSMQEAPGFWVFKQYTSVCHRRNPFLHASGIGILDTSACLSQCTWHDVRSSEEATDGIHSSEAGLSRYSDGYSGGIVL
jgi:hypothetical protein